MALHNLVGRYSVQIYHNLSNNSIFFKGLYISRTHSFKHWSRTCNITGADPVEVDPVQILKSRTRVQIVHCHRLIDILCIQRFYNQTLNTPVTVYGKMFRAHAIVECTPPFRKRNSHFSNIKPRCMIILINPKNPWNQHIFKNILNCT